MKAQKTDNGFILIRCPGCKHLHALNVENNERPKWGFNYNYERPTFTPSLLVTSGHYIQGHPQPPNCEHCNEGCNSCGRCHSFITDGKIQFLSDCTHELVNQTVELPDINSDL